MSDKVQVKIQRVKKDDEAVKPVSLQGFVGATVPCDGFIVKVADSSSAPLFVRDADLERSREIRRRKGRPIFIDAESWEGDR